MKKLPILFALVLASCSNGPVSSGPTPDTTEQSCPKLYVERVKAPLDTLPVSTIYTWHGLSSDTTTYLSIILWVPGEQRMIHCKVMSYDSL